MPTISMFNGIKVFMNWNDHSPPHFHASYSGNDIIIAINSIEVIEGKFPSKQLKLLLEWGALHQSELLENWKRAENKQELISIQGLN